MLEHKVAIIAPSMHGAFQFLVTTCFGFASGTAAEVYGDVIKKDWFNLQLREGVPQGEDTPPLDKDYLNLQDLLAWAFFDHSVVRSTSTAGLPVHDASSKSDTEIPEVWSGFLVSSVDEGLTNQQFYRSVKSVPIEPEDIFGRILDRGFFFPEDNGNTRKSTPVEFRLFDPETLKSTAEKDPGSLDELSAFIVVDSAITPRADLWLLVDQLASNFKQETRLLLSFGDILRPFLQHPLDLDWLDMKEEGKGAEVLKQPSLIEAAGNESFLTDRLKEVSGRSGDRIRSYLESASLSEFGESRSINVLRRPQGRATELMIHCVDGVNIQSGLPAIVPGADLAIERWPSLFFSQKAFNQWASEQAAGANDVRSYISAVILPAWRPYNTKSVMLTALGFFG